MAKQTPSFSGTARPHNDLLMHKRATSAAWWGLAIQALLALVAVILGFVAFWRLPLPSVFSIALLGLIPWLTILITSAFRRYKTLEEYELEAARRTGEADRTIFATEADARPAARRLARVYRWVLPAAAVLLGVLLAWHGFSGLSAAADLDRLDLRNARYLAGLFAGFAFVGFVLGRYLLGMSATPEWRVLQGGATYLIGTVYIFGLMALAAGAAALGTDAVTGIVRYVVPLFALLVGLEVLLNIVLDLYRPKVPGEMPRPAFDSRLLSLLASPANVVQSLNEAVNYQFGFEITRSWFWRLLSRSFGWLVLFGLMVLVLLSSLVIVEPHEMALKTSLGKLEREPLGPGVHAKLPWPLAMVTKYNATRIEEMVVGAHEDAHEEMGSLLWTSQHSDHESMVLIAGDSAGDDEQPAPAVEPIAPEVYTPPMPQLPMIQAAGKGSFTPFAPSGAAGGRAPSVAVAAVEVFIRWKIDEEQLADYATSAENPDQRLRQLASAAVTREMLKYTIDEAMGSGRPEIAAAIKERLSAAVENERLGIQIVWVSVVNVHPPQEVAEDFNMSAAAVQAGQRSIQEGMEAETEILTEAAGSVENARLIVAEHEELQNLRRQHAAGQATAEQVQAQQAELERLVQQAGGAAARQLLAARQRRWELENSAAASAALAPVEYAGYQQAPRYYTQRGYLQVLREALADKRKFLLMSDDQSPQIDLDLKDSLDAVTGFDVPQRTGSGRE